MASRSHELLKSFGEVPRDEKLITPDDIAILTATILVKADNPNFSLNNTIEKLEALRKALGEEQFKTDSDTAQYIMNQSYRELATFLDGIKLVQKVHKLGSSFRS